MEDWSDENAKFLRKFFYSETGKKLKEKFKATEPKMDATNIEGRALQAAEYSQFRKDIDFVKGLLENQPKETPGPDFIDTSLLDVKA